MTLRTTSLLLAAALTLTTALPESPVWVQGDPIRLAQVLDNLLANAVKFTERGGVALDVQQANGRIRFEIRDTGKGIPEKDVAQLTFASYRHGKEGVKVVGIAQGSFSSKAFLKKMNLPE